MVARRSRVTSIRLEEFEARTSRFSYRLVDPDLEPEVVANYFGAQAPPASSARPWWWRTWIPMSSISSSPPTPPSPNWSRVLVTSTYVATGREQKMVYFLTGHGERGIGSRGPGRVRRPPGGAGAGELPGLFVALERGRRTRLRCPTTPRCWSSPGRRRPCPRPTTLPWTSTCWAATPTAPCRRENGSLIFLSEPDTPESFRTFLLQWGILLSERVHPRPGLLRAGPAPDPEPAAPEPAARGRSGPAGDRRAGRASSCSRCTCPEPPQCSRPTTNCGRSLPLGFTSLNSFLIDDPDRIEPITDAGEASDPLGPFVPALLVRSVGKVGMTLPARVNAGGSPGLGHRGLSATADFLSNTGYGRGSGANLFLNSANFLMGDYSLVSIRPPAFSYHGAQPGPQRVRLRPVRLLAVPAGNHGAAGRIRLVGTALVGFGVSRELRGVL